MNEMRDKDKTRLDLLCEKLAWRLHDEILQQVERDHKVTILGFGPTVWGCSCGLYQSTAPKLGVFGNRSQRAIAAAMRGRHHSHHRPHWLAALRDADKMLLAAVLGAL